MVTAIVTIVIFLVLITLHEFGHFIMAKSVGVKVLEFAVGMGPAIFKRQKGETLYSIRIFPIGGYCRMEGEDEETDDQRAFCNQKLWKRFIVVAAGAILNVILGFVIFIVIVFSQDQVQLPVVDTIDARSNLAQSGVLPGDEIIRIDGKKVHFYRDIPLYTSTLDANSEIDIRVKRDGQQYDYKLQPVLNEVTYQFTEDGINVIDVMNGQTEERFIEYGPGEREQYAEYIGKEAQSRQYILGFHPKQEDLTVLNVLSESYHNTGFVVRLVYSALGQMITGQTGIDQMSGPIGIVSEVNTAVNSGSSVNVLSIMALLTISLGIFNLLPLPALDGGRLFFMIIELIRRKPIPPEKEGMVHAIGLLLLLLFALVISFNDILKLVGKG